MSNDKLKIKEIKSTSELGVMLDTERPWIELTKPPMLPEHHKDVEVQLKNGKQTIGFYTELNSSWYVRNHPFPNTFDAELKSNPVIAWREIVTDNK